jgi:hypothetical protein
MPKAARKSVKTSKRRYERLIRQLQYEPYYAEINDVDQELKELDDSTYTVKSKNFL